MTIDTTHQGKSRPSTKLTRHVNFVFRFHFHTHETKKKKTFIPQKLMFPSATLPINSTIVASACHVDAVNMSLLTTSRLCFNLCCPSNFVSAPIASAANCPSFVNCQRCQLPVFCHQRTSSFMLESDTDAQMCSVSGQGCSCDALLK